MSAERLAALKASAARTRLRMQMINQLHGGLNGRPVGAPPTQGSPAITRLMPKVDPRVSPRTRPSS